MKMTDFLWINFKRIKVYSRLLIAIIDICLIYTGDMAQFSANIGSTGGAVHTGNREGSSFRGSVGVNAGIFHSSLTHKNNNVGFDNGI